MESRNQPKPVKSVADVKKTRFRIERLEERIAPDKGGTLPRPGECWNGHEHRDGTCHYHGRR